MAEGNLHIDVRCVDNARPALDRLLVDLRAIEPFETEVSPIVIAAEVAVLITECCYPPRMILDKVIEALPRSATMLERGLAMGMALILAVRPAAV